MVRGVLVQFEVARASLRSAQGRLCPCEFMAKMAMPLQTEPVLCVGRRPNSIRRAHPARGGPDDCRLHQGGADARGEMSGTGSASPPHIGISALLGEDFRGKSIPPAPLSLFLRILSRLPEIEPESQLKNSLSQPE